MSENADAIGPRGRLPVEARPLPAGYVLSQGRVAAFIFLLTALMAALLAMPRSIYVRSYLQDTLGFLDGIHRMVLGQIPHRDFSTSLGIFVYGVPALFVRAGAAPLTSLSYAAALLLVLNFFILWHLLTTRLHGLPGLVFAVWCVLALSARLFFGEDPEFVTLAGFYNRFGVVLLCELLILFIPPAGGRARVAALDALCIGVITTILLYAKVTYGLCALAIAVFLVIYRPANLARAAGGIALFLLAAIALELAFHFHRAFLDDVLMATRVTAATGGRLKSAGPYEVIVNFPELVACILLPMAILIRNRLLTFRVFLLFACVGVGSVLLMNQSAQLRILALPFALLFIALRLIEDGAEHAAEPSGRVRLGFANQAMQGLILVVWFLYCYPLAVNIPLSFVKSLHGPVAVPGAGLLGELRVERRAEPEALAFDPMDTSLPPEEIYERAINSRQVNSADVLSAQQYVASLADGVRAVQDACGPSPRVLTADFVNPFPAVLDLPVGGGMIFIHPGLLVSQQDHPVAERLFRDVTCVMIPKLPVVQRARPFVLGVYADYLGKHFEEVKRTAYWTVLRSKTP